MPCCFRKVPSTINLSGFQDFFELCGWFLQTQLKYSQTKASCVCRGLLHKEFIAITHTWYLPELSLTLHFAGLSIDPCFFLKLGLLYAKVMLGYKWFKKLWRDCKMLDEASFFQHLNVAARRLAWTLLCWTRGQTFLYFVLSAPKVSVADSVAVYFSDIPPMFCLLDQSCESLSHEFRWDRV